MTAFAITDAPPKSPDTLMREHITAMRRYAGDLEDVLGVDSPIVKRIRVCARSNEAALERWDARETESPTKEAGAANNRSGDTHGD